MKRERKTTGVPRELVDLVLSTTRELTLTGVSVARQKAWIALPWTRRLRALRAVAEEAAHLIATDKPRPLEELGLCVTKGADPAGRARLATGAALPHLRHLGVQLGEDAFDDALWLFESALIKRVERLTIRWPGACWLGKVLEQVIDGLSIPAREIAITDFYQRRGPHWHFSIRRDSPGGRVLRVQATGVNATTTPDFSQLREALVGLPPSWVFELVIGPFARCDYTAAEIEELEEEVRSFHERAADRSPLGPCPSQTGARGCGCLRGGNGASGTTSRAAAAQPAPFRRSQPDRPPPVGVRGADWAGAAVFRRQRERSAPARGRPDRPASVVGTTTLGSQAPHLRGTGNGCGSLGAGHAGWWMSQGQHDHIHSVARR